MSWQRPLALGLAASLLCAAALLPWIAIAIEPWPSHLDLVGRSATLRLLGRSLVSSTLVTAIAVVLGTTFGLALSYLPRGLRASLLGLHVLPALAPPLVVALAAFHGFGRASALGGEGASRLLFSQFGHVAVMVVALTPFVTLLALLGRLALDPSLEDAARVAAPSWRVVLFVALPAAAPAIGFGALVTFALAFGELGVPMFLRVDVYPAAVFARLGGFDAAPGEAAALALPLMAVAVTLMWVERRLVGRRALAVMGLGIGARAGTRPPLAALALSCAAALLGVAPAIVLIGRAGGGGFRELPGWLGDAPATTLGVALSVAIVSTALALVIGHALARGSKAAAALDALAFASFVAPAALLGAGLIAVWNRPSTSIVYGGLAIVAIALGARYAVVAIRVFSAGVLQGAPSHEQAARAAGAGYFRTLGRIIAPIHSRALAAAGLATFAFCLRDLETAVLVRPPGAETLAVRLFTLEANGPEPVVAALACTLIAMGALILVAGVALGFGSRSARG